MSTQDIVVTVVALATVGLLVTRWWRRRQRQEPHCANCESNVSHKREQGASSAGSGAEVKPVAFFGAARRK